MRRIFADAETRGITDFSETVAFVQNQLSCIDEDGNPLVDAGLSYATDVFAWLICQHFNGRFLLPLVDGIGNLLSTRATRASDGQVLLVEIRFSYIRVVLIVAADIQRFDVSDEAWRTALLNAAAAFDEDRDRDVIIVSSTQPVNWKEIQTLRSRSFPNRGLENILSDDVARQQFSQIALATGRKDGSDALQFIVRLSAQHVKWTDVHRKISSLGPEMAAAARALSEECISLGTLLVRGSRCSMSPYMKLEERCLRL